MKKNQKIIVGVVVAVVVIGAIAAIIDSGKKTTTVSTTTSSATATATANAVATNVETISDYMFMPSDIKVKVGTTVTWTNKDAVQHNIVADNPSSVAPNGPLFGQNQTYSFKFTKAGVYTFHCVLHPYMHGTVVVTS